MKAEQLTEADAEHGEGPVWSPSWGGPSLGELRWVDTFAGDLLALGDDGTVTKRNVDKAIGALRPRAGGGMIVALERRFALAGADGELHPLGEVWDTPGVQFNDGGCDPQGRFYCGSMAVDNTPGAGRLYRLDPDGTVHVALREVTVSNGIGWSPDGGTAYYIDTPTMRVDAFDHDPDRGLSGRRPLVRLDEADGVPDGLAATPTATYGWRCTGAGRSTATGPMAGSTAWWRSRSATSPPARSAAPGLTSSSSPRPGTAWAPRPSRRRARCSARTWPSPACPPARSRDDRMTGHHPGSLRIPDP